MTSLELWFTSSYFSNRLAKDQTDINRIIAEASKGSAFYEARSMLPSLTFCSILIRRPGVVVICSAE